MTDRTALLPLRAESVLSLGLGALVLPTTATLVGNGLAVNGDPQSLIVMAIAIILIALEWPKLKVIAHHRKIWPLCLFLPLLLSYTFGRSYDVLSAEALSLILILWVVFYDRYGRAGVHAAWFPLLFLLFAIPVPGVLLNKLTGPLKIAISWFATLSLRSFDYPVARAGVTLYVAQHQLLVEDACAGLNTLTSLVALSCFYIYVARPRHPRDAIMLLLMVFPIAVLANFIRVILLILITYYLDNETAQSFIHEVAGLLMAALALVALMAMNAVLRRAADRRQ